MKKYILLLSLFFINLHSGQSISIESTIKKLKDANSLQMQQLLDKKIDSGDEELYNWLINLFEYINEAGVNKFFKFLIESNRKDVIFDLVSKKHNSNMVKFFLLLGYDIYFNYDALINAIEKNDFATVMFFVENISDLDFNRLYSSKYM